MKALTKEHLFMEYIQAKNSMKVTCLKKCLILKDDEELLTDPETTCLQNCGQKMSEYLKIAHIHYSKMKN